MNFFKQNYKIFLFFIIVVFFTLLSTRYFINQSNKKTQLVSSKVLGTKVQTTPTILTPTTSPTATLSPAPTKTSLQYVYTGIWTQGFWTDANATVHPEVLQSVQKQIGKKVAIAHFYTGWHNLAKASLVSVLQTIRSNGWRPMVSINPYFSDNCQANGKSLYKAIAEGNCDNLLHEIGKRIKDYGGPLFVRFAWEMNIDSMNWSIQKTGSSPSEFIQAWRRFHDIVVSEGGTNALWVFCPNVIAGQSIAYAQLYPGDTYVDWVGLDGYNWGTTQTWSKWESFATVFASSYASITAIANNKPLMIAEVNSTEVGGNKAQWYNDMLTSQIPYHFPRISAVVFYNEDRSAQEKVNWLIDSSPQSLKAFSAGIQNSVYLSSF